MSEDVNPDSSKSKDHAAESKFDGIQLSGSVHIIIHLGPGLQIPVEQEQPTESNIDRTSYLASSS